MFYPSNCSVPLLFYFVNSFIAGLLGITYIVVRFRLISANFLLFSCHSSPATISLLLIVFDLLLKYAMVVASGRKSFESNYQLKRTTILNVSNKCQVVNKAEQMKNLSLTIKFRNNYVNLLEHFSVWHKIISKCIIYNRLT